MSLVVAYCPLHVGSFTDTVGRRALHLGASVYGFTECYRPATMKWLRARPRYRVFTGASDYVDARGRRTAWDCVILVRRFHKILEHGSMIGSKELPSSLKVHPQREIVWVIFRSGGPRKGFPVLTLCLHPHPGSRDQVQTEYSRFMKEVEKLVGEKRKKYGSKLRVVIVGDLQRGRVKSFPHDPLNVLERLNMVGENVRIDWVAWSKNLTKVSGRNIEPKDLPRGIDHPWMVRKFK